MKVSNFLCGNTAFKVLTNYQNTVIIRKRVTL